MNDPNQENHVSVSLYEENGTYVVQVTVSGLTNKEDAMHCVNAFKGFILQVGSVRDPDDVKKVTVQ